MHTLRVDVTDILRALVRGRDGLRLPKEVEETWRTGLAGQTQSRVLYGLLRDLGALGGYLKHQPRSDVAVAQVTQLYHAGAARLVALEAQHERAEAAKERHTQKPALFGQDVTASGAFRAPTGGLSASLRARKR